MDVAAEITRLRAVVRYGGGVDRGEYRVDHLSDAIVPAHPFQERLPARPVQEIRRTEFVEVDGTLAWIHRHEYIGLFCLLVDGTEMRAQAHEADVLRDALAVLSDAGRDLGEFCPRGVSEAIDVDGVRRQIQKPARGPLPGRSNGGDNGIDATLTRIQEMETI